MAMVGVYPSFRDTHLRNPPCIKHFRTGSNHRFSKRCQRHVACCYVDDSYSSPSLLIITIIIHHLNYLIMTIFYHHHHHFSLPSSILSLPSHHHPSIIGPLYATGCTSCIQASTAKLYSNLCQRSSATVMEHGTLRIATYYATGW